MHTWLDLIVSTRKEEKTNQIRMIKHETMMEILSLSNPILEVLSSVFWIRIELDPLPFYSFCRIEEGRKMSKISKSSCCDLFTSFDLKAHPLRYQLNPPSSDPINSLGCCGSTEIKRFRWEKNGNEMKSTNVWSCSRICSVFRLHHDLELIRAE